MRSDTLSELTLSETCLLACIVNLLCNVRVNRFLFDRLGQFRVVGKFLSDDLRKISRRH